MYNKKIEWFETLKKFKCIMIFGAKQDARTAYSSLKRAGYDIKCFMVSRRDDNPFYLEGKPVKTFEEISEEQKKNGLAIISQTYECNDAMERLLREAHFCNVLPSANQNTSLRTKELDRYRTSVLNGSNIEAVLQNSICTTECDKKICIYAVTSINNLHKEDCAYQSKYIKYIQAGAKLADKKICNITDDTGDNISELNPWFCELTAGYWIYKNDQINDYIGIYHYSRGLDLSDKQIESLVVENVDAVLPVPLVFRYEIITSKLLAQTIFQAIKRLNPEYLVATEKYFYHKIFLAGNIVFAKKRVFCDYYSWMFRVLNECIKINNDDPVKPRQWGYYAEHLTNIYFIYHASEYKIVYSEIKNMY